MIQFHTLRLLTDIVVGDSGGEFESIGRRVRVLEQNRVLLLLFWFVTIDESFSSACVTVTKEAKF